MKYLLVIILSLNFLPVVYSQTTYAEIGATSSFFKHYASGSHTFGGQATVNYQFANNIVLGAGIQVLQFKQALQIGTSNKSYYPLYAVLGYNIPLSGIVLSVHADEGYGIYKSVGIGPSDGPTDIRGGFYFSPGISLHGTNRFSPYIDVRYTRYQFSTDYGSGKYMSHINAFTASAGLCILHKKR